ncbi:MAG: cation-translocating P-type ATPase [Candidatus Promineifilaceae bacterium]|nr:cation-translocating P-type ATPase [Candidatus Promineifilaceae bacterium]
MVEVQEKQEEAGWYGLDVSAALQKLGVDPEQGLSSAEVTRRLEKYGRNELAEAEKEPAWRVFLRQYADYMQIMLLAAAVLSLFIADYSMALLLFLLTLFNAIIGFHQEGKAEESVAALKQMLQVQARVRRDGGLVEVGAEELVPGDIVLLEAGDLVPADGRLIKAATLEIEESALTGESQPVSKSIQAISGEDVPLGDRFDVGYMNSLVTRGTGELLVTTTGMGTEIGRIAGMLDAVKVEKSPLQKQIDDLTKVLGYIAVAAMVLVVGFGLLNGVSGENLFVLAVAIAVAAVPTGMPTVVTTLLSLGTQQMANKGAIVKKISSVETLGSTSAICSDKTGTLTLNKMTATHLIYGGNRYDISGVGYGDEGHIKAIGGVDDVPLEPVLMPMALCSDATVTGGELVGDPTEGALVALAAKGGLSVSGTRERFPRLAEVPFDSDYKYMATFHHMNGAGGPVVRCYVKGAPDVLFSLSSAARWGDETMPMADIQSQAMEVNQRLGGEGLRVLALAQKDFDAADFDPDADLFAEVKDLTLMGLVGIVDPPRPEAKDAIAVAHEAGITVRMITGDHAVTAGAIGRQLGITGEAIAGHQLDQWNDEELAQNLEHIGVIGRVAPEHKVRIVEALQSKGQITAMTGDGVNDAPALKTADIGIAMGITGTEVSKQAAVMILTDDNFATIVRAVELGRAIYDNLMKYLRFQLTTLMGYIIMFVGASALNIAGGEVLNASQILWINFLIDVPLALGLGMDAESPGLMKRKPRPSDEKIMGRKKTIEYGFIGLFIAALPLLAARILVTEVTAENIVLAQTMVMATLGLIHVVMGISSRSEFDSIFSRDFLRGGQFFIRVGIAVITTILATELGFLQNRLQTTSLSVQEWVLAAGFALVLLVVMEVVKWVKRRGEN